MIRRWLRVPPGAGWAFADQALSSLTNAGVTVVAARTLSPRAFGTFALAFIVYELLLAFSRALTSEPLVVRFSATTEQARHGAIRGATGAAFVLGSAAGAVCLAAGLVFGGTAGAALVPLGIFLPFLLAQDAWRFGFYSAAQPAKAFVNDLVWALAQGALLAAAISAGRPTVGVLVSAWGLAAAVAAAAGALQFGALPAFGASVVWFGAHRDLGSRFSAEFMARAGARQLTIMALAAVGGFEALGAVRAAQVVFGPLNVVMMGANLVAVPEAVRLAARSRPALRRFAVRLSIALAALGVVAGLVSLLVPGSVGRALVGESWEAARPVLLPQAAIMAGLGASAGALVGLRALAAANRSLGARLLIVPLSVGGGVSGSALGGAAGAMSGLALANWLGAAVFWRQYNLAASHSASGGPTVDGLTDPDVAPTPRPQ